MLGSIQAGFESAVQAGKDLAAAGGNKIFQGALENVVNEILEQMGPMAGEQAVEQIKKKKKVPDKALEPAKDGACEGVQSCKAEILEFVQSAADDPKEAVANIGTLLLRAIRKAATAAVKAVINNLPFKFIVKLFTNTKKIIQQVFDVVAAFVKGKLEGLTSKIPGPLVEKLGLSFDFDEKRTVTKPKAAEAAEAGS